LENARKKASVHRRTEACTIGFLSSTEEHFHAAPTMKPGSGHRERGPKQVKARDAAPQNKAAAPADMMADLGREMRAGMNATLQEHMHAASPSAQEPPARELR
jgi:hypothetical protein